MNDRTRPTDPPIHRATPRRPLLTAAAAIAAIAAAAIVNTNAQQQIIGGHGLDASLQAGSSGFNTRVGTPPGLRPPRYNVATRNPAANRYGTRPTTVAVSSAGVTNVATRGRGGPNTLGTGLTVPTYNPLARGARVQHGQPQTYGYNPAQRAGGTGYRPPTTGYRPPTTGYRPPTTGYRPPTAGYRTPTGIAKPTYTTIRVGP